MRAEDRDQRQRPGVTQRAHRPCAGGATGVGDDRRRRDDQRRAGSTSMARRSARAAAAAATGAAIVVDCVLCVRPTPSPNERVKKDKLRALLAK